MNAAPMRLAVELFCVGVIVVVAATVTWAVLPESTRNPTQDAARTAARAGSPLPMLQDIDPERLDASRDVPAVSPRPSTAPVRRVGDAVVYSDGWKVTLLTFGEQPFPSPGLVNQPKAGTRLVAVTLRFENAGKVGARANFFDFKFQHGNAVRTGDSHCYIDCPPDQMSSLELGPGGSQTRWIRFSADKADTRLSLVYERLGYREVVWNLY